MKSKLLDQFKYVKNAGTAFVRTGFDSCIAIAIGGSSSTAIKLQTCDTSDGVFEDVATLVASTEAGSDSDVGIGIDISGCKKYLKITGATKASVVLGDAYKDPNS